ncbi:MAG TPA: twin-arginine translocase subunit TatC, partial [Pirellulaceae bacterium]|nr:twin-arginine translocase subunit TatC [Pirellulaceae bacterium]
TEHGFIFEEIFIERSELARLGTAAAEPPADSDSVDLETLLKKELPAPTIDLVKTRIWRPSRARLTTLSPHEAFMIWLKAGFVTGFILASPYIFFQIWMFVAAGLYPHEQRYVYVFLPFSLVLFLAGAALAFFFVFGPVLDFLFSFSRSMGIDPDLRISEVISFVLFMPLGFGVAFQLPLVMLLLNRIGIFSIEAYLEKWRIAILGIFVISMFLTPADPVSMLLMAVPLTALYFLGVGLCQWMPRGRNPFDEAYEP